MKLFLTALALLIATVALTACGHTKVKTFYPDGDCDKIEGGQVCEK